MSKITINFLLKIYNDKANLFMVIFKSNHKFVRIFFDCFLTVVQF